MKRWTTALVCLILFSLCTAAYAQTPAIRLPADQIVKPPINIDRLKLIDLNKSITVSTAPNMSVAWHAPILTSQPYQIGTIAADGVDGGRIFTTHMEKNSSGALRSILRAIRAMDGSELWRVDEAGSSGAFGDPGVFDGKVLVSYGGKMRAYDATTSTKLWETPIPGGSFVSWGNSANGIVYHTGDKRFSGVQLAGGNYLFSVMTTANPGAPAAGGGALYVASTKLSQVGPYSGQNPKWSTSIPCEWSTPVVTKDTLYLAGRSALYAINPTDGAIKWQQPISVQCSAANVHQVALATASICVVSGPYDLSAYDYKGSARKWQYSADGIRNKRPIPVVNDVIFLPGATMTALNSSTGAKLWHYSTGKTGYFIAAIPINDKMIAAQFGSEMYVFAP